MTVMTIKTNNSSESLCDTLDELYLDFELDSAYYIGDRNGKCNLSANEPHRHETKDRISNTWYFQIIKPDRDGDNILMVAIILGKVNIAMMLIDLIPDYRWLSRQNRMFQTSLHLATLANNSELVRRLVVAGIDVHKQDWRGNTALHIACLKGFRDIAETLLTPVTYSETKLNTYEIPYQPIPQNLEIRNVDGLTCFLLATINRDRDMIDLLIDKDADINSFDMKSGKICLHILAEYGDAVLMKYLLSKPRVNVNAKTYSGHTALQIANYRCNDQIVYLLRLAGAEEMLSDVEYISD
ncbi:NF-kappa-B inhibitor cactus-like [Mercenaria mercenaria]|uniref:NF-kappa-B inhibitor cactus-like n=1 Tax=Mercenaria mercenaria TaxID=6596 RepID=UPI00234F9770|nr:NF-kappa-B inhibitor cactus-like [Mercenaria mercenaria]